MPYHLMYFEMIILDVRMTYYFGDYLLHSSNKYSIAIRIASLPVRKCTGLNSSLFFIGPWYRWRAF